MLAARAIITAAEFGDRDLAPDRGEHDEDLHSVAVDARGSSGALSGRLLGGSAVAACMTADTRAGRPAIRGGVRTGRCQRVSERIGVWPELAVSQWADTRDTLQLMTQVVGKVRIVNTPLMSHRWNVVLYVSARGWLRA